MGKLPRRAGNKWISDVLQGDGNGKELMTWAVDIKRLTSKY